MPVVQRQIKELSRRFILEGLKEGKHLSPSVLAEKVRTFLDGRPPEGPVMRVRAQEKKRRWDLPAQDRVLEELDLDLEVLFSEMRDLTAGILRRHNFTELSYQAQSRDLDIILAELSNLLFVTRNTSDRFYGAFDNFRDLSKVDMDLSTPDVVDLSEGVLVLPSGALSTRKVDLSHLYENAAWHLRVQTEGNVKSSLTGSETPFGNAFHDLMSVWRHDVVTDAQGPVSVEFTIPVSGVETQEVSISRLQLISHSAKPTRALALYSTDNVNYIKFPQGSEVTMGRADREYNLDTAQIRMQYLRLVLTKDEADVVNPDGTYLYSFGLKHLGLYSVGRALQAEMISKALAPQGMTDPITRVSIRTTAQTPGDTRVRWAIKGIDGDGNEVGDWRPFSPINSTAPQLPTVIKFGNEANETFRLTGAGATVWSSFRNAVLYKLADSVLPAGETSIDVLSGTAKLYRGLNAWSRNRKTERRLKRVRDAYVTFDTGDRQNLWASVKDNAVASTREDPNLQRNVTHLVVSNPIDYDPETMRISSAKVPMEGDPTPRYAIASVLWYRPEMQITEDHTVDLDSYSRNAQLGYRNVVMDGESQPLVTSVDGLTVYKRDIDYTVFETGGGLFGEIGVFVRPIKGGASSSSQFPETGSITFRVVYQLDPDITDHVHKIEGSTIVLQEDLGQTTDETFEVTYRFVPKGDFRIIKSTIKVTPRRDQGEGTPFKEGPDYNVDINRGILTRIPSGDIQPDGENIAVYVDFYYEAPASLLETYTLWAFSEKREPARILFSEPVLDHEAGEQFYIRTRGETVDLSRSTESPPLAYGWHQFVVRSRNPDSQNNAAIRKIAALVDTSGEPVFIGGGKYFSRIMATRTEMKQVEQNYLLTNILPANHGNFAVTSDGEVVVNYLPGSTEDLFTYALRAEDGGGLVFEERDEEYELTYVRRIEDATEIRKVRVRASLSRTASADGALTPKVDSYDLKIG